MSGLRPEKGCIVLDLIEVRLAEVRSSRRIVRSRDVIKGQIEVLLIHEYLKGFSLAEEK